MMQNIWLQKDNTFKRCVAEKYRCCVEYVAIQGEKIGNDDVRNKT
jgi:hypothetical protein